METLKSLIKHSIKMRLGPIVANTSVTDSDLQDLRLTVVEQIIDGLYQIFEEEHVVSIPEARDEAYSDIIAPAIDRIFRLPKGKGSWQSELGQALNTMEADLQKLIRRYQQLEAEVIPEHSNAPS